jgi:hypothetical protein
MSRRRGVSDRVVTLPFKFYSTSSIATGTTSAIRSLLPNFGRPSTVSPAFEFYRFTKLRLEIPPLQNNNSADTTDQPTVAIAFFPEIVDATTTTISVGTVLQQLRSTYQVMQQSDSSNGIIPGSTVYRSFSVPTKELLAVPLKWYPVVASSIDADFIQGTIVMATTSVVAASGLLVPYVLTGEVQFRGFADLSITLAAAADEDEKKDGVVVQAPPLLKPSSLSRRPRV